MKKITKILTFTAPFLALAPLATLTNTNTTSLQSINKETATPSLRSSDIDVTVKDSPLPFKYVLEAHIVGTYHNDGGCIDNAILYISDTAQDYDGGWDYKTISLPLFSYQTDELQYHSVGGLNDSGEKVYIHINIKRNKNQDTLNVYVKEYDSTFRTHKSFKL